MAEAASLTALVTELARISSQRISELERRRQEDMRDIGAAMERMVERITDKIDENHSIVLQRLSEVCDRGGEEHAGFARRIDALEVNEKLREAERRGRLAVASFLRDAARWLGAHGWKGAIVVYAAVQTASSFALGQYRIEPPATDAYAQEAPVLRGTLSSP